MRKTLEKNWSGAKNCGMWKSSAKSGNCLVRSAGSWERNATRVRGFCRNRLKTRRPWKDSPSPYKPFAHPLPVIEDNSSHPRRPRILCYHETKQFIKKVVILYMVTSQRKKSQCFFSEALFTNSLNGRVLRINKEQIRNLPKEMHLYLKVDWV